MNQSRYCAIGICVLLTSWLASCSSTPSSRLYLLEPMVAQPSKTLSGLTIAVARVTLPEYLKRDEILSREQQFRVTAAGFDRWAEPLDFNIGSVLAENLARLIPTDRVFAYPWDTMLKADYNVRLRILDFSISPDARIVLNTSWIIFDGSNIPLKVGKTGYRVALGDDDGDGNVIGTVGAMSHAVEQLSRDIATAIESLDKVFSDPVSAAQMGRLSSFIEKRLSMHRQSGGSLLSYQPVP